MPKGKSKYFNLLFLVSDVALLMLCFSLAYFIRFGIVTTQFMPYLILEVYMLLLWVFMAVYYKLYDLPRLLNVDQLLWINVKTLIRYFAVIASSIFLLTQYDYSRIHFILVFLLFAVGMMPLRVLTLYALKAGRSRGMNKRTVVFVGGGKWAYTLFYKMIKNSGYGFEVLGVFDNKRPENGLGELYRGTVDEVEAFTTQHTIDEMIIALPDKEWEVIEQIIQLCERKMIRVRVVPQFSKYISSYLSIDYVDHLPLLSLRQEPLESMSNRIAKRIFDLVFASLVIVLVFSWLFPLLALLIKLTSKGPVFFKQLRSGRDNKDFVCYKFRTMVVNDQADRAQATQNDHRVTRLGAFMRKTNLDELPQFFNVLRGEMSVVGPRPHMLLHTDIYGNMIEKYMVRHFAKPGISGWAQVTGLRGETKEVTEMEDRAKADIWYIENWTLMLDLKIIVLTVLNMLRIDPKAY